MIKHTFHGTYTINIFDFPTRFVNEADILHLSQAQGLISIQTYLAYPAERQLCTYLSGASCHGWIMCWPEDIQYLLSTKAAAYSMREVPEHPWNITQNTDEVEEDDGKQRNDSIFQSRNIPI